MVFDIILKQNWFIDSSAEWFKKPACIYMCHSSYNCRSRATGELLHFGKLQCHIHLQNFIALVTVPVIFTVTCKGCLWTCTRGASASWESRPVFEGSFSYFSMYRRMVAPTEPVPERRKTCIFRRASWPNKFHDTWYSSPRDQFFSKKASQAFDKLKAAGATNTSAGYLPIATHLQRDIVCLGALKQSYQRDPCIQTHLLQQRLTHPILYPL